MALVVSAKQARRIGPNAAPDETPPVGGFAQRVVGVWHNHWEYGKISTYPGDVQAINNMVLLAFMEAAVEGTGSIYYPLGSTYTSNAEMAADVDAFWARGVPVTASIGGSSMNGKIKLLNNTHRDQMLASIVTAKANLHIKGIDFDMESEPDWNVATMSQMPAALKAAHGNDFIVGFTMGLYGQLGDNWLAAAGAAVNHLDYVCPMLYDFPECNAYNTFVPVIDQKIAAMANAGIPRSKMILGFMTRVSGQTYVNASPVQVARDVLAYAHNTYPGIRGAFLWEDGRDSANTDPQQWAWHRGSGADVRAWTT